MKNYFYIIKRDGHVIEIENIGDRFSSSLEQLQKSGMLVFSNLGIAINTVDISDILNEERYQGYIDSVQPKLYIRDGTWRDIKERKVIRYEKWKENELEGKRKNMLNAPEENERIYTPEEHKALFDKYRPVWMKNNKEVVPPHDPELTINSKLNRQ